MGAPVIEIAGVWMSNKGAELMAWTAVGALSARLPDARFVSMAQGPDAARAAIGMPPLPGSHRPAWQRDLLLRIEALPSLRHFGLRRAVTHVVDISGFAYGDYWGVRRARNRAGNACRAGLPAYLMPQSFGPFEDPRLKAEMTRIMAGARLVAPRDGQSRAHLEALGTGREMHLAPDITFGLDVAGRAVERPEAPYAALILNDKLVATGGFDAERLVQLYADAADHIAAHGVTVTAVLHEPKADRALTDRLCAQREMPVIALDDARDLKAYLAGAACIVTGRYHGLVSGLAAGVPSFAVGWSHKYRELLTEFDSAEMLHTGDDAAFLAAIDALLGAPGALAGKRAELTRAAGRTRKRLAGLWDRVAEDIAHTGQTEHGARRGAGQ